MFARARTRATSQHMRAYAHGLWDCSTSAFRYSVTLNKFADLSSEEFATMLLRPRPKTARRMAASAEITRDAAVDLPIAVDWRGTGAVTSIKNQGNSRPRTQTHTDTSTHAHTRSRAHTRRIYGARILTRTHAHTRARARTGRSAQRAHPTHSRTPAHAARTREWFRSTHRVAARG